MQFDDGRPQLGYRGSVSSRAIDIVLKVATVIVGGIALAGAFVLSLAFFAVALAFVLIAGGYLWWKTRELRRQMREQMHAAHAQARPHDPHGNVIDGVVISREQTDEKVRPSR